MNLKNWKKDIFTIPNLLSLFRLVLIPIYVTIYLNAKSDADHYLAAGILAVSCLTDMVDGQIARRFNMISTTGKILDPLADKITQFTLILCLAIKYPLLWSLVGLFFLKEIFQLIAGLVALRKGWMLKGALISGKICTTLLFVSLTVLVLFPTVHNNVVLVITVVDFIALVIAFIDYARTYFTHSSMLQDLSESPNQSDSE